MMRNPFRNYWRLVDPGNPSWSETNTEYDTLDQLKFRAEQLTGLRKFTKSTDIMLVIVLDITGNGSKAVQEFNNWQAIRVNSFKRLETVELEDWFTIRKMELS